MKNGARRKSSKNKLKEKLVKDTKVELHNELAKTLEDALQRKRKGDIVVDEWIRCKKYSASSFIL
jgi:hypothetical protein